jgi:hypothetical protein
MFGNRALRRIFEPKREGVKGDGKNFVMKGFTVSTSRQISTYIQNGSVFAPRQLERLRGVANDETRLQGTHAKQIATQNVYESTTQQGRDKSPPVNGLYLFRIHVQIYHLVSAPCPNETNKTRRGQLTFQILLKQQQNMLKPSQSMSVRPNSRND